MTNETTISTAKPIYFIGGNKGGVGKSLVTIATLDYLQQQNKKVFLIESDTTNPDVWKAYKDITQNSCISLDDADGWITLVNLCDANKDSIVVVNSAARNNMGVSAYGQKLNSTVPLSHAG